MLTMESIKYQPDEFIQSLADVAPSYVKARLVVASKNLGVTRKFAMLYDAVTMMIKHSGLRALIMVSDFDTASIVADYLLPVVIPAMEGEDINWTRVAETPGWFEFQFTNGSVLSLDYATRSIYEDKDELPYNYFATDVEVKGGVNREALPELRKAICPDTEAHIPSKMLVLTKEIINE